MITVDGVPTYSREELEDKKTWFPLRNIITVHWKNATRKPYQMYYAEDIDPKVIEDVTNALADGMYEGSGVVTLSNGLGRAVVVDVEEVLFTEVEANYATTLKALNNLFEEEGLDKDGNPIDSSDDSSDNDDENSIPSIMGQLRADEDLWRIR